MLRGNNMFSNMERDLGFAPSERVGHLFCSTNFPHLERCCGVKPHYLTGEARLSWTHRN